MKHKQRWAGAICCFVLFIVVCLFLATHMKGAFGLPGILKSALLFFILPEQSPASFHSVEKSLKTSVWRNAGGTLFDAHYAAVFSPTRSFWQELAWLLSAVFWCALGHCVSYLSVVCFKPQHRKNQ